jgi:hypothetical protein
VALPRSSHAPIAAITNATSNIDRMIFFIKNYNGSK